jgi:serine beta-lactamase-like protein LACTB
MTHALRIAAVAALATTVIATAPTGAQSNPALLHPTVRKLQAEHKLTGIAVGVVKDGELLGEAAEGFANLDLRVPVSTQSRFRIASVTKAITAVAVLKLHEQQRLDLDAPVQKYCAKFPAKSKPVTARLLLGHLAGVRHYRDLEGRNSTHYNSVIEALGVFADDPLLPDAGAKYSYSSYGYVLLACVVEGASGMLYPDYMQREIFAPAGMTETVSDDAYQIIERRVDGYWLMPVEGMKFWPERLQRTLKPDLNYRSEFLDVSIATGAGNYLSTVGDVARFAIALLSDKLISSTSRMMMWTEQTASTGEGTGAGLGWFVSPLEGRNAPRINGSQSGTSAALVLWPETKNAVVVLSNQQYASVWQLASAIRAAVLQ